MEGEIEDTLGSNVTVDRSEQQNQDKDGYIRFKIKSPDHMRKRVRREINKLERRGIDIKGEHRELDVDRRVDGSPMKELGARLVIYVEE